MAHFFAVIGSLLYERKLKLNYKLYENDGQLTFFDKEIQKDQMQFLSNVIDCGKNSPNFFKANKIANKAVKLKFGIKTSLRKKDMTQEMLLFRAKIMNQVIALMVAKNMGAINKISPIIYQNL